MTSVNSYEEAYAANQKAGGAMFTSPTLRRVMFGLQLAQNYYPTDHGAYFVTSTRRARNDKRTYQVRFIDGASGRVVMVMEGYQSNYGATNRAKALALDYQHGCQLCRKEGHSPADACLA